MLRTCNEEEYLRRVQQGSWVYWKEIVVFIMVAWTHLQKNPFCRVDLNHTKSDTHVAWKK